jgi:hypothetical protein
MDTNTKTDTGAAARELTPVMRETLDALKKCRTLDEQLAVYNAGVIALGMEMGIMDQSGNCIDAEELHLESAREKEVLG